MPRETAHLSGSFNYYWLSSTRAQILSPLRARHRAAFWEHQGECDLNPALTEVTASDETDLWINHCSVGGGGGWGENKGSAVRKKKRSTLTPWALQESSDSGVGLGEEEALPSEEGGKSLLEESGEKLSEQAVQAQWRPRLWCEIASVWH